MNQGLKNLGSTCAINSLIQIICRNNILRDIILNDDNIKEDTLIYELKEILDLMYNKKNSLSPNKFINILYKHFESIFIKGEQLDIGELWTFLLDKIKDEVAIDHIYQSSNIINNDIHKKYYSDLNIYNNYKTSKLIKSTQGFLLNIIKCKNCNNILYNFEPFTSLSLDIHHDDTITIPSITSMFSNFIKEELRNDDWKCEKCNKKTDYIKKSNIWTIPDVLVIIIKRFNNNINKNSSFITINKELTFKKGTIIFDNLKDINFELSSIGIHYGNLNGGHYCAICKDTTDNKYIYYDDLNIKKLDDDKFLEKNNDAYMIIYNKI